MSVKSREMIVGPEAAGEMPGRHPADMPPVLLPYQQELLACRDEVVVVEKSRRIGISWAAAAEAVTVSSAARGQGGDDALYVGYTREMAEEFIEDCVFWSRHLAAFAGTVPEIEEYVFEDETPEGKRSIQAFRIRFKSGFKIAALSSRPRGLRGRQGFVIVDEAAFHDDLEELLTAAFALLMWGSRVWVISTHNGADNPFNELIQDIRAGAAPYKLLRFEFDHAVRQGLYRRICLVRGIEWTPAGEAEWVARIRSIYRDKAAQELDVIPSQGGGVWLPLSLLEMAAAAGADIPVLRWQVPDAFAEMSEAMREAECRDWLERHVAPLLAELADDSPSYFGMDFGRTGHLSVIWPVRLLRRMERRAPFVIELRNVPFEQQRQVLFYVVDRLPRFSGGAMDAGGNGSYLAEVAWQRYGTGRIERVKFTVEWYREHMPPYKAAMQDGEMPLPRDRDIIADHRAIVMEKGVARVPEKPSKGRGGDRHGDAAIAGVLAHYATRMLVVAYGYEPAPRLRPLDPWRNESGGMFDRPPPHQDFGIRQRGAW